MVDEKKTTSDNKIHNETFRKRFSDIKSDLVAGLIVAIVALPLAIGFAIASGVPPIMGIYAAIIGGFVAAIFGGSEFQISGPTGAMVVVILAVVSKYGTDGLIVATILAGIILLLLWLFNLGKAIEYIPHPVIVGFTAGIAVLIFFGQLNNFFGISPIYPTDAGFFTKTLLSIEGAIQANIYAVILAFATVAILILMRKFSKKVPGSIVAVLFGLGAVYLFNATLHLKTVKDIGAIATTFPMPHIPNISWSLVVYVLPAALTIAALAAIESLLSAVVADGMTGKKHDSNKELRGQGLANIASALFGGLPVTGAIARTATNIRNGGKTRLVGIIHAIVLLGIILLLGPVFSNIPLAVIAGILMFVAFNMVEWNIVFESFRMPLSDVAVMAVTFSLTVFVDLTLAIEVGIVLAALLFMKRMGDLYNVEEHAFNDLDESKYNREVVEKFHHPDISIYTLNGPLFFGAAAKLDQELSNTPGYHKPIKIIRMKYVPVIDASGISMLQAIVHKHKKMGGYVIFSTIHPNVLEIMKKTGLADEIGKENIFEKTSHAFRKGLAYAHKIHNQPENITAAEIEKYDLKKIDEDDKMMHQVNDKDPVEDMIRGSGIITIHNKTKQVGRQAQAMATKYSKIHKQKVQNIRDGILETEPSSFKSEKIHKMKRLKRGSFKF